MCSAKAVILTRPERVAHEFAAAMKDAGITCPVLIAPLREVSDLHVAFTVAADETVLISSAEAARIAGARLNNQRVLAIGAGTGEMAKSHGALVDHISLNAQAMINYLRENLPPKLLILRGDPYSFDPVEEFDKFNLCWRIATIYHVRDKAWPQSTKTQISRLDSLIFPLFSVASWSPLADVIDALPSNMRVEILPISQNLLEHVQGEINKFKCDLIVLEPPSAPNRAGMLDALRAALAS